MDNLLELLVPLIIAAIYFFGSALGKKGGDGEAPSERPAGDGDAERRQREIQAEIRRRIMERRRAAEGGDEGGAAEGQSREVQPAPLQRPQAEPRRMQPERRPATIEMPTYGDADTPTLAYRRKMEEKMAEIRATQERAEALKREAQERRRKLRLAPEPEPAAVEAGGSLLGGSVVKTLRSPAAARAAFVYAEVLGPPAASRAPGPRIPALSDRT